MIVFVLKCHVITLNVVLLKCLVPLPNEAWNTKEILGFSSEKVSATFGKGNIALNVILLK